MLSDPSGRGTEALSLGLSELEQHGGETRASLPPTPSPSEAPTISSAGPRRVPANRACL